MDEPIAVGETVVDVAPTLVRPDGATGTVALRDPAADRPVLFGFYIMDFSPDCIEEWCSFRDFDRSASDEHVRVVGCSKSSAGLHRRFIDYLGLQFPLCADPDLRAADAFGRARRSRRSCFLLEESPTVRYRWLGEHRLDPARDTPPIHGIHGAIVGELDAAGPETFGF